MPSSRSVYRRRYDEEEQERAYNEGPYGYDDRDGGRESGSDRYESRRQEAGARSTPRRSDGQLSARMRRLSSPSKRHDRRAASPSPSSGDRASPYRRSRSTGRPTQRATSPSPRVAFGQTLKDPHPDEVRRQRRGPTEQSEAPEYVDRLTDRTRFTGHHRFRGPEGGPAGKGSDGPGGASSDFASVVKRSVSPSPAGRHKAQQTPRGATPTKTKGNIFEKLTDHREYTGYHRHRFDAEGNGKGKAGRDTVAKGSGSFQNTPNVVDTGDEVVRDMSQLLRPHLHPAAGSARKKVLAQKSSRGRDERQISPEPTRPEVKGTIFERLTDSKLYTGHHKHRFDQETGEGLGLDGRDSLSKGTGSISHVEIRPDGDKILNIAQLFRPHLHDVPHPSQINEVEDKRRAKSPHGPRRSSSNSSGGGGVACGEVTQIDIPKGSIFEKLTDPKEYTGHHRHRFDAETGLGLGLDGRDRNVKGAGTEMVAPVTANGDTLDIVHLMRPNLHNALTTSSPSSPSSPRVANTSNSAGSSSPSSSQPAQITDRPATARARLQRGDASGAVRTGRTAKARRAKSPRGKSPRAKSPGMRPGRGNRSNYADEQTPEVFTRLADPARFTGHHKHRFDDENRGCGLAGRDSVVKGGGTTIDQQAQVLGLRRGGGRADESNHSPTMAFSPRARAAAERERQTTLRLTGCGGSPSVSDNGSGMGSPRSQGEPSPRQRLSALV